ncbi:hypothetical protein BC830DRAFT_505792 [Chytriomyces sp. MP71]|nr:hypothetical protein BC830DRAFT_505792 [Chytriomyces sp. MP71]
MVETRGVTVGVICAIVTVAVMYWLSTHALSTLLHNFCTVYAHTFAASKCFAKVHVFQRFLCPDKHEKAKPQIARGDWVTAPEGYKLGLETCSQDIKYRMHFNCILCLSMTLKQNDGGENSPLESIGLLGQESRAIYVYLHVSIYWKSDWTKRCGFENDCQTKEIVSKL